MDTNSEMLKEATIKLKNNKIQLVKIQANQKLPFKNNSFDYITICNVLFHLKNNEIDLMLNDAIRLLKPNGKTIILSPTGNGNLITLLKNYFSFNNYDITIWFYATKSRAKQWINKNYLKQYTNKKKMTYNSKIVMNGLAQIEIISI